MSRIVSSETLLLHNPKKAVLSTVRTPSKIVSLEGPPPSKELAPTVPPKQPSKVIVPTLPVATLQDEKDLTQGFFQQERTLAFVAKLKAAITSIFGDLQQIVTQAYPTNKTAQQSRFIRGIESMDHWGEDIYNQEVESLKRQYPAIEEEYLANMQSYALAYLGTLSETNTIKAKPFAKFLSKLLWNLSQTPEMRSRRYFKMSYLETNTFLTDIIRNTFGNCILILPKPSSGSSNPVPIKESRWNLESRFLSECLVGPKDSVSNIFPRKSRKAPKSVVQEEGSSSSSSSSS